MHSQENGCVLIISIHLAASFHFAYKFMITFNPALVREQRRFNYANDRQ